MGSVGLHVVQARSTVPHESGPPELGTHVVFLCTGNAARSVVAGAVLISERPDLRVTTAGTHVIEGQPVSRRTREALATIGLGVEHHRSRQLTGSDLIDASLVIGFAAEHVYYVRRNHPEAAARTATLRMLCRELAGGPSPLEQRVAGLELSGAPLQEADDVSDPAGGDQVVFEECAREVKKLVEELAPRL